MTTAPTSLDRLSLFVGGRDVGVPQSQVQQVLEASTGCVLGRAALASPTDVDAAVVAARSALQGPWGRMDRTERHGLLLAFAKALKARAGTTSRLVSQENGMPVQLSAAAEGYAPSLMVRYYADLADGMDTEELRTGARGSRTVVRRTPVGVVAAITPWNYPQGLAAMKIAPALAAGCTVVLKPAPETALDAHVYADAAREAGLPDGVLNIVPGGRESGAALVGHTGVDKVAFTGSTAAGRAIGETCGRLLRPVTLELGGKSAAVLAEDADLEAFLRALPEVCLPNNGQTCHASTRILAPRARYQEVVDAVTATVAALRVGDALDPETQIGPLVSAAQRDRVLDYVSTGLGEGARLTTGGGRPAGLAGGWFVEPTVFADVDNRSRLGQEEVFGPLLCVLPYDGEEDAVRLANDSEYGLGGTVWSADEEHGRTLASKIRTGTVGVNHYALDLAAPFGGVGASGVGRELGPEGLVPYLTLTSMYLSPAPGPA